MQYVIDLAGVAGAIAISMGLALWLEWLSLRGLMMLMPARPLPVVAKPEVAARASNSRYSGGKAA